ncbi:helix-turn-helix transcriptional regulator [Streptosporangium sp. 'caverna']|uniref:helix-turn-helix transcriptional regulator n=1 Tax=Streptosporangium sp. 'caverna' TaxID=2202249 RepID=UPI000D7DEE8F|nr:helix-turn-helix transcriptional regulator [Streptosporangium sp. 'caverna']AWS43003.1 transcriptional regulator [Streptosporangium sp. 'caverna']
MDKEQLADFLRRRREALQPGDVGLPKGLRRRATGLRREEVSALAQMSTDYYNRLEQQRSTQPSPQILTALAHALRLTTDERDHLFRLAGHTAPPRHTPSEHVSPGLLRILDRLDDTPAQVISDLGEIFSQNRLAIALLGDHTHFTGPERSFIWRWFTDPSAREIYPPADHDHHSRVQVADLRSAVGRRGRDFRADALVSDLRSASEEFATLWDAHKVAVRRSDHKRIAHPLLGIVELDCQILVAENEAQRLLIFTAPVGSEGAQQLQLLSVLGIQDFEVPTDTR